MFPLLLLLFTLRRVSLFVLFCFLVCLYLDVNLFCCVWCVLCLLTLWLFLCCCFTVCLWFALLLLVVSVLSVCWAGLYRPVCVIYCCV